MAVLACGRGLSIELLGVRRRMTETATVILATKDR